MRHSLARVGERPVGMNRLGSAPERDQPWGHRRHLCTPSEQGSHILNGGGAAAFVFRRMHLTVAIALGYFFQTD